MRWSNIPVPEVHVAALLVAGAAHLLIPLRLPLGRGVGRLLGAPLIAAGTALSAWAVASAGETDVDRPDVLVTDGAYAASRNPMYVGWSAGVLGLALWTRSAWLVAAWVLAVRALDREIDAEEAGLAERFGPAHSAYRDRVPRYLARL